jgi:parvulin-like peptidyl-prolyl isomerase
VSQLEPEQWHGPVLSGYGVHFVYVEQRSPAVTPEFDAVREKVQRDWGDDRRNEFDAAYYAGLRARYEVVIEDEEPGEDVASVAGDDR